MQYVTQANADQQPFQGGYALSGLIQGFAWLSCFVCQLHRISQFALSVIKYAFNLHELVIISTDSVMISVMVPGGYHS